MGDKDTFIAVIGLGYVGLPVAIEFSKHFNVIGFDVLPSKIRDLINGIDRSGTITENELRKTSARFTSNPEDISACNFYIITVPTPIDKYKRPDLTALIEACETVGKRINKGDIIVFESTVFPGATEEICIPILEERSGLSLNKDFGIGYSPERINPGDKEHTLTNVIKVISASSNEYLEKIDRVYRTVIKAGTFKASSIKVAEAAKVIENTQRDINVALVNELALIFDRMGLRTIDVLRTAATKWNFLEFYPGLVGGHCIGVDPYYLTSKAEILGYYPEVILAGRRINDSMGIYIAHKMAKLLSNSSPTNSAKKVGVLGVTFKENVPDTRNSRVPELIQELEAFGIQVKPCDPVAQKFGINTIVGKQLIDIEKLSSLDGIIIAVPHAEFLALGISRIQEMVRPGGVIIDVKSKYSQSNFPNHIYWSL